MLVVVNLNFCDVAFRTSETSPTASSQDSSMALCEEEPMAGGIHGGDDLIIAWVEHTAYTYILN